MVFDIMDENRMSYELKADSWAEAEYKTPANHHIFGITVEVIDCPDYLIDAIINQN